MWWSRRDAAPVRALLGPDLFDFGVQFGPIAPLASCVAVTGGRRSFFEIALERFLAQDYLNKELVVIDEGAEKVFDLVRNIPRVQYIEIGDGQSLSLKRNLGCSVAKGDLLLQWDDDDWYGSARISRQVKPLIDGRADITALEARWIADLRTGDMWTLSPALHRRMFYCDVHGGTLAFTRAVWTAGVRYSEGKLTEDVAFLHAALLRGQRLLRVANDELFVYMRHYKNTWDFSVGHYLDPRGWGRAAAPKTFSTTMMSRFQAAARN